MKKFEGNINGKIYTDEKEFDKALSTLERSDNMYVSYRYVSVPDTKDETKLLESKNKNKAAIECNKNYVSENQYVRNINNSSVNLFCDNCIIKITKNKSVNIILVYFRTNSVAIKCLCYYINYIVLFVAHF
jgi:hypothetical protein